MQQQIWKPQIVLRLRTPPLFFYLFKFIKTVNSITKFVFASTPPDKSLRSGLLGEKILSLLLCRLLPRRGISSLCHHHNSIANLFTLRMPLASLPLMPSPPALPNPISNRKEKKKENNQNWKNNKKENYSNGSGWCVWWNIRWVESDPPKIIVSPTIEAMRIFITTLYQNVMGFSTSWWVIVYRIIFISTQLLNHFHSFFPRPRSTTVPPDRPPSTKHTASADFPSIKHSSNISNPIFLPQYCCIRRWV